MQDYIKETKSSVTSTVNTTCDGERIFTSTLFVTGHQNGEFIEDFGHIADTFCV